VTRSPQEGVLHDLGYQPYRGVRLAQARRFLVIAKNVVTIAWRQKWGVRLPVLLTGLITIIGGVFIYIIRYATALVGPNPMFPPERLANRVVLETSASLGVIAFVLGVRVGATAIADDLRVGAFQFYFSRTIRPADYLVGKLLGIAAVMAIPLLGAPFVLALFRVLLSQTWSEAGSTIAFLPGAFLFGLAGTAAYAMPAAAAGAIMQRRLPAQALYAGFYLVGTFIVENIAEAFDIDSLRALEPHRDVVAIGQALFDVHQEGSLPPVPLAALALAAYGALGVFIVHRRVARAETTGMGGG